MAKKNPIATIKQEAIRRYYARDYTSLPDLANELDTPLPTLKKWLYRSKKGEVSVREQRDALEKDIKKEAVERAKNELTTAYKSTSEMMTKTLGLINQGIENGTYTSKELPDIFSKLGSSLKNIHSTLRLEDGKSTSNLAIKQEGQSISDMQAAIDAIRNDPFGGPTIDVPEG